MNYQVYQCTYPGCRHTETFSDSIVDGFEKSFGKFQHRHQHGHAQVEMRRVREVPNSYTDSLVGDKRSTKQHRE